MSDRSRQEMALPRFDRASGERSSRMWILSLASLTAVLAAATAAAGLFTTRVGDSFTFVTSRGETVEMFGRGVYFHDSLLVGSGSAGVDLVTLVVGVPLLAVFTVLYARGSARAALLLLGMLGYLGYVYAGRTLGTAYNELFLVYILTFSACVFGGGLLMASLWRRVDFGGRSLPRRSIATVTLAVGVLTLVLWLESPVTSLVRGKLPATLDQYTTLFTHGIDLAIVVPLLIGSGVLISRGSKAALLAVFPVISLIAMLAPTLTAMTFFQLGAGVEITPQEMVAYVVSFVSLGIAAAWVIWRMTAAVESPGPGIAQTSRV